MLNLEAINHEFPGGTFLIDKKTDQLINASTGINEKNKKLTLDVLASYKGIKRANLVIPEDVSSLLEPWLGKYANTQNLPIPIVIDAEIDRNASIDVQILTNKLSKLIPNITLDDHREWLNNFYRTLDALEVLASFVVLLIVLSLSLIHI